MNGHTGQAWFMKVVLTTCWWGGGGTDGICEVYDSTCKKFVVMNSNSQSFYNCGDHAVLIGRNILVFKSFSKKLATYNVDKNE